MKKIVLFIMATIAGVSAATAAAAPTDSLLVARKFATDDASHYDCQSYFDVVVNGVHRQDAVEFRYVPSVGITRLSINDKVIVDDSNDPIQTLPWPVDGVVDDVWIHARGEDSQGNPLHYGYAYLDKPSPGDSVWISLDVGWNEIFVKFDVPEGVDPSTLRMRLDASYGFYEYDANIGGFRVSINAAVPDSGFEVSSNGGVIGSGTVDYRGDVMEVDDGMFVNFTYPGGVDHVDITDYHFERYLNGLTLDGYTVSEDGEFIPAKVVWVTKRKDWSSLPFNINGVTDVDLEVWAIDDAGELVQIHPSSHYVAPYYGLWLYMDAPYEEIFVVITHANTNGTTFGMSFGGGKG